MKGKPWDILITKDPTGAHEAPYLPTTVKANAPNSRGIGFFLQLWKKATNIASNSYKRRWLDKINYPRVRGPHEILYSPSGRRALAALLSICICTTMLTYMIPMFSTRLHTIESELVNGEGLVESSISTHSLFQSTPGMSTGRTFHSGRRLASTQARNFQNESKQGNSLRILERFRRSFVAKKHVYSLLKNMNRTNILTTFLGSQLAYASTLAALPKKSEDDDDYTTVISVYRVRNGNPSLTPTRPHRGTRSDQMGENPKSTKGKISTPSTPPASKPHYLNQLQNLPSVPQNDIGNELVNWPFKSAGIKERQESNPLVNVGHVLNQPLTRPQPRNNKPERGATQLKGEESNLRPGLDLTFLSQGLIEISMLHSGSSFCRIYNVGRLAGGKLVLPEWMKKHSVVLLHQCGVKDPIYAIKSKINDKQFILEQKRLNVSGRFRVIDNSNMDLVGTNAPRYHMPHFVTDILSPLRVTELLKGSRNDIAKLLSIRKSSSANNPEATRTVFADLRPSLFLGAETWQANSTAWVQRLAKFFSHPAVGYSLLSEEDRRRPKETVPYDSSAVWRFRSVLSDNLNIYEGEGLFDVNGNNFVFSRNGLSGAPAWTIKGISQEPCRVSVTALTRTGPRALLHLEVLRKVATKLFASGGLVLDFKVAKFENTGFETQVKTMRGTNVLIATHGAGNTNVIFMRRGATVIEVFPFAYRAGPFGGLARIFGLEYKAAMSAPQTKVFKECMGRYETKKAIKKQVFRWWDKAAAEEKVSPWVHRLELEKEFGKPGKSEGMATRRCVRMQQLAFDTKAVADMAFQSAKRQCNDFRFRSKSVHLE